MKQNRLENSREKFPCREWAHLYKNKAWLVRRQAQLSKQPLCEECLKKGRVTLATVADHIVDHKGDPFLFYQGELQSLCPACHSSKTNSDRKRE